MYVHYVRNPFWKLSLLDRDLEFGTVVSTSSSANMFWLRSKGEREGGGGGDAVSIEGFRGTCISVTLFRAHLWLMDR